MTIKVYSSIMPGEPDEVYHDHGVTVSEWLAGHTDDYRPGDRQPLSCAINGAIVPPSDWCSRRVEKRDSVEFRVVPHGDVLSDIWSAVTAPFRWLKDAIMPGMPTNNVGQGQQGASLSPAEAKANSARLGEGVPEIFGQYIRYPDYLNQPRRYYQDRTTQVLRLMLAVGVGDYEVDPGKVKIGQTPMNDLPQVDYQIFAPGASVSGNPAHQNWYECPEVGATTGSAGIRLKGITYSQRTYSGNATVSGNQISGISAPATWTIGLLGSIKMTQGVEVESGSYRPITVKGEAVISGGNFSQNQDYERSDFIPVNAGDVVTYTGVASSGNPVAGYNSSKQWVQDLYTSPSTRYLTKDKEITIPSGVAYVIACSAYDNSAGSQFPTSPLILFVNGEDALQAAAESEAYTVIGSFGHLALGMTVNAESDFGVNGSYVVGFINSSKTQIELETTSGDPVTGLATGSKFASIDKAGTAYELTSKSTTSITVRRVLAGGMADPDWSGQLPQGGLSIAIVWQASGTAGNRVGPFAACPSGELTSTLEVDIFASAGMGKIDNENINARTRTVLIEWREFGDVIWISQSAVVSGATRDQLGWTFTVNLPYAMRPEVRVARIGAEDVSVASLDRLEFTAMRARLPTVTSYPGITTMAVTITGSDEIGSGSNNKINLVALRKLPVVVNSSLSAPTTTRSISAASCYVAKSLGYADAEIDLDAMQDLETIWTNRGDTFDYVINDGTAKDAIDTILRAGFAEMTLETGVIKPVRDQIRTRFEDGYSPENMTKPLQRTFEARQVDEADGVEVEYTSVDTWTTETVKCFLPGDQGIKLDKIKVNGVTDRTRAWRIGMRRRRAQKYRRWTYSFETELDALNSEYLSYVPLLDDVPGYGKVAILEAISADRITVSEPLEFEPGKTHVVAYRGEDGETVGPFPCTQGSDDYTLLVTIPQPWPAVLPADRESTHVYFGTTDRWSFPALITEISPGGPLSVSVSATNYDSRVYADDDNSPA